MNSEALPKVSRSESTRNRLLAAAVDEFNEHGLAGARVDRIAERAGVNKRLIYVYFGSKEALFDAVIVRDIEAMTDAMPFRVDDIPGYAVELYDYLAAHPELLRLYTWRNLERPGMSEIERRSVERKIEAMTAAQQSGRLVSPFAPADLLQLAFGLTIGWATASAAAVADDPESAEALHQQRRETLRTAVACLLRPPDTQ